VITSADVEAAIASGDIDRLQVLPVVLALHHPDRDRATQVCERLAAHPDPGVRGNAVLGFGHLARRFGSLEDRTRLTVERALVDPDAYVRGHAHSAAEDMMQFLGWRFTVGTHVDRILWTGRACGRSWRVRHVGWIARGDPPADVWLLTIETTDDRPRAEISSWWSRESRVLGGRLPGWSKSAIGNLKRALAQSGPPVVD
jgi:hypothetical protein